MKKFLSRSSAETFEFARRFASELRGGEVIGLVGDLGAGKTVFSQGLAKGLGIKTKVTSPTFVVMRLYPVKHPIIKHLCHIDAYRLTGEADLAAIGALDYFSAPDTVTLVEWADRVQALLPQKAIILRFQIDGEQRQITSHNDNPNETKA